MNKLFNWLFTSLLGRFLLIILAIVMVLSKVFPYGTVKYHIDVDVYRYGAMALLDGVNPYDRSYLTAGTFLAFTYPPLALLLFIPLALMPLSDGEIFLSLATVLATWWVLHRIIIALQHKRTRLSPWISLALLSLFLFCEPVVETFRFGQINVLIMALVVADFTVLRESRYRGILVGFAAAIKLTPAVFGLYFLLKKDWRGASTCTLSGLGWTLLAAMILPSASWQYWTDALLDSSRIGRVAFAGNQSLRGFIARFIFSDSQIYLWVIVAGLIFILAAFAIWRLIQLDNFMGALAANSLIALLISPISWSHHWVWFMLFLPICLYSAWYNRSIIAGILGLGAGYISLWTSWHWSFAEPNYALIFWSPWQKIIGSSYVLWGILFLITAAISPKSLSLSRESNF